jgi:catechol 2,3-dioxygenase-like lactoylglutathione lyase family enzyme
MSFTVHKIDHVNAVVIDLEASVALWRSLTGLEPHPTATHETLGLRNADFVFADGNQFGLMTPLDNEMGKVIQGFIDRRGEGLYIISLAVHDPDAVSEDLTAQGIRMVPLEGMGFVHPKSANGVSVEFIKPGISDKPPSPSANDVTTHRVVGLHHISLAVDDLADTTQRWEKILGGVKVEPAGHAPELYRGALAMLSNGGIGFAEPAIRDESNIVFRAMRNGEGFLSVALEVDDVEACASALNAKGWQVNVSGPGTAYVSAKNTSGVMVELMKAGG